MRKDALVREGTVKKASAFAFLQEVRGQGPERGREQGSDRHRDTDHGSRDIAGDHHPGEERRCHHTDVRREPRGQGAGAEQGEEEKRRAPLPDAADERRPTAEADATSKCVRPRFRFGVASSGRRNVTRSRISCHPRQQSVIKALLLFFSFSRARGGFFTILHYYFFLAVTVQLPAPTVLLSLFWIFMTSL